MAYRTKPLRTAYHIYVTVITINSSLCVCIKLGQALKKHEVVLKLLLIKLSD